MDLFVMPRLGDMFNLEVGRIISGYKRATWIERFVEASEFSIEAPLDSNLREILPIGSLLSHIETDEVCMVENHEISIDRSPDIADSIVISGSSLESFLEHRIVGSNKNWPEFVFPQSPYEMAADFSCVQARRIVADHINWEVLIDDNDWLPNVNVSLDGNVRSEWGILYQPGAQVIERAPLYKKTLDLLAVDNLGFCTRRPRGKNLNDGRDVPSRYFPGSLTFHIYPAKDRSKTVAFSHVVGDIKKANYLFSNKDLKTSCLIYSTYFAVMVHGAVGSTPTRHFNRRVMLLDATDLDEAYDSIPGAQINAPIQQRMAARGRAALAKQNFVALSNVELQDQDLSQVYRKDYELGDYVSVYGDYQASTTLQVTEHVEIDDETGYSAYPTFSEPITGAYYVPSQHVTAFI